MKKKTWNLKAFADGDWEFPDNGQPTRFEVTANRESLELIAKTMKFMKEAGATGMNMAYKGIEFNVLDDDGNEYNEVDMMSAGSVAISDGYLHFRLGTKHGYGYVMTEDVAFNPSMILNPRDSMDIHWDIESIINHDQNIVVTDETARSIMDTLKEIEAIGDGVGEKDVSDALRIIQPIPEVFRGVANGMNIDQYFSKTNVTNVNPRTLIFFEMLERRAANNLPEGANFKDMVNVAFDDLDQGKYSVSEAVDEAIYLASFPADDAKASLENENENIPGMGG